MSFCGINMIEDGKAFRCFSIFMERQIFHKFIFHLFSNFALSIVQKYFYDISFLFFVYFIRLGFI